MSEPKVGHPLAPRTVGEALMLLHRRSGLSREEIAAAAGVSPTTITRYEGGETDRVDLSAIRRIVGFLAPRAGLDPETVWSALGDLLDQANAEAERRRLANRGLEAEREAMRRRELDGD